MTESRKQISEDGLAGNEFLINEEFTAILTYYVVTSLSAKSSETQIFRTFNCERMVMCKAHDGQQDRKTWSLEGQRFLRCLTGGFTCFQRLQASGRAGFRLGSLPTPIWARCRWTTCELYIAPCEALQAIDRTGLLRALWLWLLLPSFQYKHERRSKHQFVLVSGTAGAGSSSSWRSSRGAARTPRYRSGPKDIFSHFEISENELEYLEPF